MRAFLTATIAGAVVLAVWMAAWAIFRLHTGRDADAQLAVAAAAAAWGIAAMYITRPRGPLDMFGRSAWMQRKDRP